ncbi:MAG: hypothetical protein ACP5OR_05650 [Candidatus Dormibacteria bacterium]
MEAQEVSTMSSNYQYVIRRFERKFNIHTASQMRLLSLMLSGVFITMFMYMIWACLAAEVDMTIATGRPVALSFKTTMFFIIVLLAIRHGSPAESSGLQLDALLCHASS